MSEIETQAPKILIAIFDDILAPPTREKISPELLKEFCEAVEEYDLAKTMEEITGVNYLVPDYVDDNHLRLLFETKPPTQIEKEFNALFLDYVQRKRDLTILTTNLENCGCSVVPCASEEKLFAGPKFPVVFLDLYLEGNDEAEAVRLARRIYSEFKAFVFLMSDKANASGLEEEFRRQSRLLRGFFHFCKKDELRDSERVKRYLGFVPSNSQICHAIYEFVDSVEFALGGSIEEPSKDSKSTDKGIVLAQFMKTLRTLDLQDYAMLCELTLRDEGHPLGDYLMRLLVDFLNQSLLQQDGIRESVKKLDQLRFTEFLPFRTEVSDSLKELYAASLFETVANPWAEHPWEILETDVEQSKGGDNDE